MEPRSDRIWVGDGDEAVRGYADVDAATPAGEMSVLVEVAPEVGLSAVFADAPVRSADLSGVEIDEQFAPVPLTAGGGFGMGAVAPETFVVRATVPDESAIDELRGRPGVAQVWRDTPIAPFQCPIPPCDCTPGTPKGTIIDVANYLGVSQVWTQGFKGSGIVVGVVDGGITAQGRTVKPGETSRRIPRVIGGWPTADWGTEASRWGEHGNMCATDVLGMAPESQLYDLRISGAVGSPGTISRALQAFQWAIDRHKADGTPHVLSNSWGIYQEDWDATYARNPNHPFTLKMVEALDRGIVVLFAAGNCGGTCPDNRCGADNGPGRSIWGANSHPRVMTVGAVNKNEEFVGYSSQGPGALDPNKPDFCCVTHFTGYFNSDNGTSAATPVLAGAVALLKEALPTASPEGLKNVLRATAKDIGPAGWDQHSGAGIVRIKEAFDRLRRPLLPPSRPWCAPSVITPCLPPTRTGPCLPSRFTPCLPPSRTVTTCPPSSLIPCDFPTRIPIQCGAPPTSPLHGCTPPTFPPACQPPTDPMTCGPPPSRVCPTIVCGGQPPGGGWYGGYGGDPYGGYDPAALGWYQSAGWGASESTDWGEEWYGA